jgi:hypothetical protein
MALLATFNSFFSKLYISVGDAAARLIQFRKCFHFRREQVVPEQAAPRGNKKVSSHGSRS